ncbi:hypothetical protein JOM56_014301, partial [Amanita muscaria]
FEEAGCAVCGELKPLVNLSRLKYIKKMLHILHVPGITRMERKKSSDLIREFSGPVIDHDCDMVCDECRECICKGRLPRFALAKGMWIGKVP